MRLPIDINESLRSISGRPAGKRTVSCSRSIIIADRRKTNRAGSTTTRNCGTKRPARSIRCLSFARHCAAQDLKTR